ncbi:DNA polymerase III subunit gamma and tau [Micromonospora sp. NBC_01796]|uniref:DNA polymerase III subunit gamma and tau n=1 Tax=Micromonospora sp. NBC_01796 TaxID=2975987 RepID=UPI002DD83230|nr:DNA polymerase III subunit gamma and tau [Micromonospora sp. NBC_01796]WSA88350.1 DNA polymerase III subunit gamma and tau [Micromonospora sp. NBC_01796]
MALALYRKYRPRTFAEVIGQEHVTEPLSQALRTGRLNHAYLFSGPRGCGKTSSARILARSLNCEQGPTPEPCGVCDSCRSLAGDGAGSLDVIEIDAASHGGVDDARDLRERAFFAPANSRFKIYVIDEAHMVSSAGFNALLKLVEEPPEFVKFIFATTEPEKVLGTIKSRTHHYPFRLIPPGVLRPYLEQLTEAEGVKVEPAVFPLVVRAGGGSARDSLSVLDQLIAGAGPEGVSYARAVALLGVTDAALIDEMCDALAAGDGAAAYGTVDRVAEAGHDPRRFATDLLERLRDLIVLQQVPDAAAKGLIDGPSDQIERMTAQAQKLGPATLSRCADIVHNGLVEMRGTTAPRLLLELVCARMLLPGAEDSTGGLLQRLERMERRLTHVGDPGPSAAAGPAPVHDPAPVRPAPAIPSAPVAAPVGRAPEAAPTEPPPSAYGSTGSTGSNEPASASARRSVQPSAVMPDPATPDPVAPGSAAPGVLDAAAVRRQWGDVVGMINRTHKRIAALVRDAVVRDLDGNTLVLTVKSPVLAQMLTSNVEVVTEAIYQEFGERWQIRCEVAGDHRSAGASAASRPAPAASTAPPAPAAPAASTAQATPAASATPAAPAPAPAPARDTAPHDVPAREAAAPREAAAGAAPRGTAPGDPPPWDTTSGAASGSAPGGESASAGRSGGGSGRTATAAPVNGAGDTDWPEAARPGGAAAVPAPAAGGSDWPEPARPGGANPVAAPASGGRAESVPGARVDSAPAAPPAPTNGAVPGGPVGNAQPSAGLAAARAAAAGRGPKPQAAVRTADRDWAGDPPYDPDYDGPPRAAGGGYEGFDPGDEPLDEVVDERTARQTSEQQAMELLRQQLGAERIGDIDNTK